MNHQEIEQQEIIERYVRHKLPPDERRAFEEHFFACDECFEQVQSTAQFIAAVRHSSQRGILAKWPVESAVAESWWKAWFKPALILTAAALAVAVGYVFFAKQPAPREETAQSSTARPTETNSPSQTPQDVAVNTPPRTSETARPTQAKTPTVLLDSARDARGGNQLLLPADAANAKFLVEVEPGTRFDSFQLLVFDAAKLPVTNINGIKATSQGVVTATVSARLLPNGKFLVKLYGVKSGVRELVGEYDLTVRRQ